MCFPVEKCCFCVNLSTGTRIISVFSTLSWLAVVVIYAGAALATHQTPSLVRSWLYLLVASAALCQLCFSTLLLYGAFWNKPGWLWPWLATSWLWGGWLALLSLLGLGLLAAQHVAVDSSAEVSAVASCYFVSAVIIYFCATVVNSRRVEMLREEQTEAADRLVKQRVIPKSLLV